MMMTERRPFHETSGSRGVGATSKRNSPVNTKGSHCAIGSDPETFDRILLTLYLILFRLTCLYKSNDLIFVIKEKYDSYYGAMARSSGDRPGYGLS